jgi:hypothetical protein
MTTAKALISTAVLSFAAVALLDQSASAQVLIAPGVYAFTSRSAYESATDSLEDGITFNALATKSGYTYLSPGFTTGGVAFSSTATTDLYAVGPNYVNGSADFDFTDSTSPDSVTLNPESAVGSSSADLTATLPVDASPLPSITAVGTDIATSYIAADITATVDFAGGQSPATYFFSSPDGITSGLGFLGFVTTGPDAIDSVTVVDSTVDSFGRVDMTLDNLTYGIVNPSAVPEPSTYAMMLGGLALLGSCVRRKLTA